MLRTVGEAPGPVENEKDSPVVELPDVRGSEDVCSLSLGRDVIFVVVRWSTGG